MPEQMKHQNIDGGDMEKCSIPKRRKQQNSDDESYHSEGSSDSVEANIIPK